MQAERLEELVVEVGREHLGRRAVPSECLLPSSEVVELLVVELSPPWLLDTLLQQGVEESPWPLSEPLPFQRPTCPPDSCED